MAEGRRSFVPWSSAHGSDFNYDFQVTLDESRDQVQYNFARSRSPRRRAFQRDAGYRCFLRDGEDIYHTYSTFARGADRRPHLGLLT